MEGDARGQGSDVGGGGLRCNGNADAARLLLLAVALEMLADALVAALFDANGIAGEERFEFGGEIAAFDEEAFAGGIAPELGQDAQRLARADVEEGFDGLAVDGGGWDGVECGEGGGNVVNPFRMAGHEGMVARLASLWHDRAKIGMIKEVIIHC
jgi:hypothetical protein